MQQNIQEQPVKPISSFWSVFSFLCAALVLAAGAYFSITISDRVDADNRANLLTRVQTIAHLIDGETVDTLTGSSMDLSSEKYVSIKSAMYELRQINTDARFIYLMRSNGSKLVFLIDSELPGSEGYSPPGQVYEDTSTLQFNNYVNEVSFTEGPYTDSWGTWVSAYAPVYGTNDAQTAIVGMDVDAKPWKAEILSIRISIIIATLILALAFLLMGLYLHRSLAMVELVQRMNRQLVQEKERSDLLVKQAMIGEWALMPKSGAVSFNDAMFELFAIPIGTRLDKDVFELAMDSDSRKEFNDAINRAVEKTEPTFTVIVKVKDRSMRLSGTIGYGSGMTPTRISGIAQNIG